MSYVPPSEAPEARLGRGYLLKEHEKHYPIAIPCSIVQANYELKVDGVEFEGIAELILECVKGNMFLEGVHFEVISFSLNGESNFQYDGRTFRFQVEKGRNLVAIKYRGRFLGTVRVVKGDTLEIASTGETENPSYWIPCITEPGVKTRTRMKIMVRKPLLAISNGDLLEVKEAGEWREFTWEMSYPHSFYLNSIAIGEFHQFKEEWEGVSLEYYLPKGKEGFLWNLGVTRQAMEFFSNYTGVKYPYKRYSQVVLYGMNGGMEYITNTHLTWRVLHDKRAEQDYDASSLISHELAHQWFGDLVTTKDWANIWLNEAFASYFQALFTEKIKGKDEFIYDLYIKFKTYLEEYSEYSRPIVFRYYKWPDELFDRHTYRKGSLVLHTLRNIVGDEIFREGIRNYLEEFSGKAVDTEDFRKVMERTSGLDLTQFFDLYLYSAGHPELSLSVRYSDKPVMILEQAQDVLFPLEIDVKIVTSSGEEIRKVKMESKKMELDLPKSLLYICVDPEFRTFVWVNDNQGEELLIREADDRDVMCSIRAANSLSKFTSERAVNALGKLLDHKFWGVSYEAAINLGKVKTKGALKELKDHVPANSKARRGVAKSLSEFKYDEEAAEFVNSLLQKEDSYYVKAELLRSLGKISIQRYEETVRKYYSEDSHLDVVRSAVIEALANFGSQENFNFLVEKAFNGESLPIRESATRWLGKFGERAVEPLSALVKDEFPTVRSSAIEALAETSSLKAIPVLKSVVNNEDEDGRLRATALRKVYAMGKVEPKK
ncbi:peptidase M1 [Metallosphaera tengchongensis]|uniref:Peptidase M1 n=1 Tax=Metallosphaera tengchongensis TaxID=1532350 RepID=A0A6N0NTJ7_9CREN|nr:M1 family aminopeptidase [Metallosphaera tengchongensis]QKR00096.1 peptidase M1 [Metallosphaera tengchongensis]